MKRPIIALVLLVLVGVAGLVAWHFLSREKMLYIDLASDLPYARQKPPQPKKPVFTVQREDQSQLLVQHVSGSISFYQQVPAGANLMFSLQARKEDVRNASVILEADFPNPFREEHTARLNEEQKIEMIGLAGRVVRITFQAQVSNPVTWMSPRIRHVAPAEKKAVRRELAELRRRQMDRNVLIVLMDAAGAAHFGCYGYPKNTTQAVDQFAKRGVIFENAVAQAAYTLASVATLFTGLHPDSHGLLERPASLSQELKTIAEHFHDRGYSTGMFSASPNVSPMFGFHQGFDVVQRSAFSASELSQLVEGWLQQNRSKKFFGYVHFREPHEPYNPPEEYLKRFEATDTTSVLDVPPEKQWSVVEKNAIQNAYDANLAYVSDEFGKILAKLDELRLAENTIVILLADHGEAFWEHGERGHNSQMYEEMIQVPLIVKIPGETQIAGTGKSTPAGLIDVLPTLADLFGFDADGMEGSSLLPALVSQEKEPSLKIVQSQTTGGKYYARRGRAFKFICHPEGAASRDELYDLSRDPEETENLAAQFPIFSAYQRMMIQKMRREHLKRSESLSKSKATIDSETEEELRSLGYVN